MRYRVHFVVQWDRDIEAKDDLEAKRIAETLKYKWRRGRPISTQCYWNTMERLEAETGDD